MWDLSTNLLVAKTPFSVGSLLARLIARLVPNHVPTLSFAYDLMASFSNAILIPDGGIYSLSRILFESLGF
jgi:hypothetical protein